MYRYKLIQTQPKTDNGRRLQALMLEYHDFRHARAGHSLTAETEALGTWQAERLRQTHYDLYQSPRYREALDFLLEDLYAPRDFTRRDDDIDRIFPYLIRLSPDSALFTLSQLVELNLLSQKLDLAMAQWLVSEGRMSASDIRDLSPEAYAQAYRACGRFDQRQRQIDLVDAVGRDLEHYVSNRSLRMALRMMHRPAQMAGLGELYRFIDEGVHAFRAMGGVESLLGAITERETALKEHIVAGRPMDQFRASMSSS